MRKKTKLLNPLKHLKIMGQINLKTCQKRIAYKQNDEKYFLTSSETYSRISNDTLIELCSENSGIPKAQMASAFHALEQQVREFLFNGHSLELLRLGTMYLSVCAKATETEDEAGAKAVKRVSVKFRQSNKLRDLINSNVKLVSQIEKKAADNGSQEGGGNTDNPGNTGNEEW